MNKKVISIRFDTDSCDMRDIASLRKLLLNNDFRVDESLVQCPDEMGNGFDFLTLIFQSIPPFLEAFSSTIREWCSGRNFEFTIEDSHSGRSIHLKSNSGLSDEQMERLMVFVANSESNSPRD